MSELLYTSPTCRHGRLSASPDGGKSNRVSGVIRPRSAAAKGLAGATDANG